jgi:hypothetical protein
MEPPAVSTVPSYITDGSTHPLHEEDLIMKSLISAAAALAVFAAAGTAMAQDAPVKHHHHVKHHESARVDGNTSAEWRDGTSEARVESLSNARTEHGGPPSSADERAATQKLNDLQLGKS